MLTVTNWGSVGVRPHPGAEITPFSTAPDLFWARIAFAAAVAWPYE